jgi:Rieske Fe-S protein
MPEAFTRREIIKTILVTTATSFLGGKVWTAKAISEVMANPIDPNLGVARVQLSNFTALNSDGGSVRLGSSNIVGSPPSTTAAGLYYPILINRLSATEYVVLDTQCLHAGCVLPTLSGGLNGRISCPCHGSQYDARGLCVQGPAPVGFSLRSYPAQLQAGGILKIDIADQGFQMLTKEVLNGAETRLQISWDSFSSVEYELRYRPDFATEPVKVNFATTLTGAASASFITGNDTAATETGARKIYVVPQDGIYQVAIRLRAL